MKKESLEKGKKSNQTRRKFLLRAAALAGGGYFAGKQLTPTAASGKVDNRAKNLLALSTRTDNPELWQATEDNILGPYHRARAPFRAVITPPLAPGKVIVIKGRVWGLDSKKPLSGVVIDIWHADHSGHYDNDNPAKPPQRDVFDYRARLITDQSGYYEYQTVRPGRYKLGDTYRPSHIHYLIRHKGYKQLITQLYFKGDPYNKTDEFIKKPLIIEPSVVTVSGGKYEVGVFNIILEKS